MLLPDVKLFKKAKRGLELVSLPYFMHDISRIKFFSCYILLTDQILWTDCCYFLRFWTIQYFILFFCITICTLNICIYIYGIHHRRILWSSYRKLAWVGFEPTTTEFHSDALTDWAIRPWVQLALSQLCTPTPISSFAQCHISFRLLPSSVATFVLIEILLR